MQLNLNCCLNNFALLLFLLAYIPHVYSACGIFQAQFTIFYFLFFIFGASGGRLRAVTLFVPKYENKVSSHHFLMCTLVNCTSLILSLANIWCSLMEVPKELSSREVLGPRS